MADRTEEIVKKLTREQFNQLLDALLSAFPNDHELAEMVQLGLDVKLNDCAEEGTHKHKVFTLIEWAEAQGNTAELVRKAHGINPKNVALRAFVKANYPNEVRSPDSLPHFTERDVLLHDPPGAYNAGHLDAEACVRELQKPNRASVDTSLAPVSSEQARSKEILFRVLSIALFVSLLTSFLLGVKVVELGKDNTQLMNKIKDFDVYHIKGWIKIADCPPDQYRIKGLNLTFRTYQVMNNPYINSDGSFKFDAPVYKGTEGKIDLPDSFQVDGFPDYEGPTLSLKTDTQGTQTVPITPDADGKGVNIGTQKDPIYLGARKGNNQTYPNHNSVSAEALSHK